MPPKKYASQKNKKLFILQQTYILRLKQSVYMKVLEEDLNYTKVHRLKRSNHDAFDDVDLTGEGRRCVEGACSRRFVLGAMYTPPTNAALPSPSVGAGTRTHSTLLTLSSSLRVKGLTRGWYGW
jgi:CRISPR/Cas system-associated endoribonuclease Cas2